MKKKLKIVITGATNPTGKALKAKLPSSMFRDAEVKLLDDDVLDGTLTDYDGGVELIRAMTVEAFEGSDLAFFCSESLRTAEYWDLVQARFGTAAPVCIDLGNGALAPAMTGQLPRSAAETGRMISIPNPLAIGLAHLLDIYSALGPLDFVQATALLPVSVFGEKGVEALHTQFVELVNFGKVVKEVFERQLIFNIAPSLGTVSAEGLSELEKTVTAQVRSLLDNDHFPLQLFAALAPVFYSHTVMMTVTYAGEMELIRLKRALEHGHGITLETKAAKNSFLGGPLESTDRDEIVISRLSEIPGSRSAFALWFNFDNITVGSVNQAIALAERAFAGAPEAQ